MSYDDIVKNNMTLVDWKHELGWVKTWHTPICMIKVRSLQVLRPAAKIEKTGCDNVLNNSVLYRRWIYSNLM